MYSILLPEGVLERSLSALTSLKGRTSADIFLVLQKIEERQQPVTVRRTGVRGVFPLEFRLNQNLLGEIGPMRGEKLHCIHLGVKAGYFVGRLV